MLTVPDSGVPEDGTNASHVISSQVPQFLAAVDIEGFSQRSAVGQAKLHDDLEYAMSEAAASAGLGRKLWYRQPRGDGELAVLPADTNGLSLVADYPRRLASVLAEINNRADRDSRLRVRMAIHRGIVYPGRFGPFGEGPITVSRLVDAQVLRQTLRQRTDLDIVWIVSGGIYNDIVKNLFRELDPKLFHRTSPDLSSGLMAGAERQVASFVAPILASGYDNGPAAGPVAGVSTGPGGCPSWIAGTVLPGQGACGSASIRCHAAVIASAHGQVAWIFRRRFRPPRTSRAAECSTR